MRLSNYAILATAFLGSTIALAAPARPAAPAVTVGAELRELIFDWSPVRGATYYELLSDPDGRSGFTSINGRIPASRTRAGVSVSVHLQHWSSARYKVAACNAAGCRSSGPIAVLDQMLDTIGYLKASNTDAGDGFGYSVALSSDGYTLAVTAAQESSNASGVNGDQSDNSSLGSSAAYVFRRDGRRWRQEAYLKAGVNQPEQYFGYGYPYGQQALAINGDGTLLAAGAGGENVDGTFNAGKVYIYGRAANGSWSLRSTLQAPFLLTNDYFGASVDMSVDGRTIKVNSQQSEDGEGIPKMRTHIFTGDGSTWSYSAAIPPIPDEFCNSVRMSGDGKALVLGCWGFTSAPAHVVTFKRSGNTWNQAADIALSSGRTLQPLALNFNATRLALLDFRGEERVVLTYQWRGARWVRDGTITTPLPPVRFQSFGDSLVFNRAGDMLVIGDMVSGAAGAGVSERATAGTEEQGAAFVYERPVGRAWTLRSVVKAPNPGTDNSVGDWVALSGSGLTLAVGAAYEDSAARGIDGDRTDTSARSAGAVYLY